MDLVTLPVAMGYKITGAVAGDQLGRSVAGVGDFNGDGLADGSITRSFLLGPGDYTVIIGGADIIGEMHESGELKTLLKG
jgi:hypothetical protein